MLTGANHIGMAVGAVLWGTIADRIGRKKAFSLTLLTFSVFSVLGAVSPDHNVFLLLRFLAGIGLGGCIPVVFAMVTEFAPRKHRGKAVASIGFSWPVGATLAGLTSTTLLTVPQNWRWMLVPMVLPGLLLFWVRRGIPESPLYLARQGREVPARQVIDDMVARTGAVAEPYATPMTAREPDVPGQRKLVRELVLAVTQLQKVWTANPRVTSVTWLLAITILLVYYTALTWMPSVLQAEGYGDQAAFSNTTVMTGVGILGVLVSVALVDVIGRRWVIALSAPLAAVALAIFAFTVDINARSVLWLALFGLLIQITFPTLWTYISELYPTEFRATGVGWASTASRVATGVSPILFGAVLWPYLGLTLTFVVLAAAVTASVIWMLLAAPETRGKELDQFVVGTPEDRFFGATATGVSLAAPLPAHGESGHS
jgi:MFS transporter, putative metabolite:H+ symporter